VSRTLLYTVHNTARHMIKPWETANEVRGAGPFHARTQAVYNVCTRAFIQTRI